MSVHFLNLFHESAIRKEWMEPSGARHLCGPLVHEAWAIRYLKLDYPNSVASNFQASAQLFAKGWLRLTPSGLGSLLAATAQGRRANERQLAELVSMAIEGGLSEVRLDNGNSTRVLWSAGD